MSEHHTPGSTRRLTLGADKGYDAKPFAAELRALNVTPHIARHDAVTKTGQRRTSCVDGRTARHPGYTASQRIRTRIEEPFGRAQTIAGLANTTFKGRKRVDHRFTFAMAADHLIRWPRRI